MLPDASEPEKGETEGSNLCSRELEQSVKSLFFHSPSDFSLKRLVFSSAKRDKFFPHLGAVARTKCIIHINGSVPLSSFASKWWQKLNSDCLMQKKGRKLRENRT